MRIKLLRLFIVAGCLIFLTGKLEAQSFSFNCARDTMVAACPSGGCITLKNVIPDLQRVTGPGITYVVNPVNSHTNSCIPTYVAPNDPAGTPTNLVVDDTYSSVINIGFPFPFFGIPYSSLVASTNGFVSFDITRAGLFAHWAINADVPSATYDRSLIMGAFHDLDPSVGTSPTRRIQYQTWGVAPHRRWILSFYRVPLFGGACNASFENTHQIILYESTGIIEVTLTSKQACTAWNSGRAIVGVQDDTRTRATMAPGRSSSASPWTVSSPESWRFVPTGGTSLFKRAELINGSGTILASTPATGTVGSIGNGKLEVSFPNVCAPDGQSTLYIIRSVYEKVDDPSVEIYGLDTIRINKLNGLTGSASFSPGSCASNSGTITVNNVVGGTGPYQYSIDAGVNWQSSNLFTGLAPGTYTVLVRDASGSCTLTLSVVVGQTGFLTASATATPTTCAGQSNGSIEVTTPGGGTGPFSVTLNGVPAPGSPFPSLPTTITGLGPGPYTVVVTHVPSGCTTPPTPVIRPTVGQGTGPAGDVVSSTPPSCSGNNDGRVTIRPTAGVAPFTFILTPPLATSPTFITGVTSPQTFTGLQPFTSYTVIIQDDLGCQSSVPFSLIPGTVTATATPSSGCGPTSGVITVTSPSGGTGGPYEYALSIGGPWQTSPTFTGLTAGNNYTVFIRDASMTCLTQRVVTIPPATGLAVDPPVFTATSCNGASDGTITVTVPGGGVFAFSLNGAPATNQVSPYTFTSVGSGNNTIVVSTVSPAAPCSSTPISVFVNAGPPFTIPAPFPTATSCPGVNNGTIRVTAPGGGTFLFTLDGINSQTNPSPFTFTGLSAGNHTIVVTNNAGCVTTLTTVNVPAGPALTATSAPVATTCGLANGSITITPTSGTAPYQFSLDGGAPVSGAAPYTFSNLSSGPHTYAVITSASGCSTGPISFNIGASTGVTGSFTSANTSCPAVNNGTITVTATAGVAPFTFQLDGGAQQAGASPYTFSNVAAGPHTVIIRDNAGCSFTLNPNVTPGAALAATGASSATSCTGINNGTITITPTNGTAPYTFSLDGGAAVAGAAPYTFNGVGAGPHSVLVTDASGCVSSAVNVTVTAGAGVSGSAISIPTSCPTAANGTITVTATGGTAPFTFQLDAGPQTAGFNPFTFTNVAAGPHTIIIRDNSGCTFTFNHTVNPGPALAATGAPLATSCTGVNNGSIIITPSNGTAPYTFALDGGAAVAGAAPYTFTNVSSGPHSIVVTDASGCVSAAVNVVVSAGPGVTGTAVGAATSCPTAANGTITVNATAGVAPFTFQLDAGAQQAGASPYVFTNVAAGSHTVIIRDNAGCIYTINNVNVAPGSAITATATPTAANCGLPTGTIVITSPAGGSGVPYEYSLDGITWQTATTFPGLAGGSYTVRIRDNGAVCITTLPVVTVPQTGAVTATTTTTVANCGLSSGSITVNGAAGGSGAPYQYSLDGVTWQPGNIFSGLGTGNYTVRVRDNAGICITSIAETVGQTSPISATVVANSPATCGNPNGSISIITPSGGTAPYEYSLDGIIWQISNTFSGILGGNLTIRIRDASGSCTATIPFTLSQTTAVAIAFATPAPATCGLNNGSIVLSGITGGTPPYQYSIDGITWQFGNTFSGLAGGNYTISVRDNGFSARCTTTIAASIAQTAAIAATTTTTTANCGAATGSITINGATGGSGAPYQYSLDGITWQPANSFTGIAGGNYNIQVRDNGAVCSVTIPVTVAQTGAVTATASATAVANCGASTGVITVSAPTGGTAPYEFSLDGIVWQLGNTFSGLAGGNYTVRVRDNGATCTITIPVTVTQTAALAATASATTAANCGGLTGVITVTTPTGGTAPYEYSLDGITWQPGNTFTGLAGGSYTIRVRDNGAVCSITLPAVVVTQTAAVTATTASTAANCGASTGSITISGAAGGNGGPYQYSLDGVTWQPTNTFINLAGGIYNVQVRDNGAICTATIPVTVAQTGAVTATASATAAANCGASTGIITVSAPTGGTAPYEFSLDGIAWQNGNTFTGLAGGNYTVRIRDAGATCITTLPVIMAQTAAVTATASATSTSCGTSTGSITVVTTTGGTAPYQYSLDGITWQVSNTFPGLATGNYTVRVRDAGTVVCSTTIPVSVPQTGSLAATTTSTAAACTGINNGSITFTTAGGTGPYTFAIDGGAAVPGVLPYTFTNVGAGPHTVVVTDLSSGCNSGILNVTVTAGAGTAGTAISTPTACPAANNGTIIVTATTGVAPYTFQLDGGAFQAGASPYTFNNVAAGTHTVIIRDNVGCIFTLNQTVTAGATLAATSGSTPTSCTGVNNGTVTITPTNGTAPYTYSLDGGAFAAGAAPYTFSNVAAGAHTIVVRDAAGCLTNTINVTVIAGSVLTATTTTVPTSCSGATNGMITVTPTGGVAPYSFSLDGGATVTGAVPYTFNNVIAGPHTIVMTDGAGCVTNTINVSVTAGPAITTTVSKTDVLCNGGITGTITVTQPVIGVAPYQYSLDGITWQASNVFAGLNAGTYTVFYRESSGCQGSQSITINQPAALTGSAATVPVVCNGQNNGTITVAAAGGVSPYQYSINGGTTWQNSNVFTVAAGSYTVSIRDVNNCIITRVSIVTQPLAITASSVNVSASCNGGNDGVITVTANGGNAGYQYSLDGITFQASNVFNVGPGNYTVTVRDNLGCITNFTTTVGLGSNFVLVAPPNPTICEGTSTQLLLNSNATQYAWTPATGLSSTTVANPFANPIVTTQYTVTATLGRCTGSATVTVNVNAAPIPNAGPDNSILCYGQTYQLQGSGGVQYLWSPNTYLNNASIANPVSSTTRNITYTLSILSDINGCASLTTDQVNIVVAPPVTVRTFPYDTIAHAGDQFQLLAVASDSIGTNYSWTPSIGLNNAAIPNPVVTVGATVGDVTTYRVIATTSAGCRGEGYVTVRIYKGPDIYVPTGFTPNGDGKNDRFTPFPVGMKSYNYFRIFNRWGQQVFSSNKLHDGWDGKLGGRDQQSGVFVWMIQGVTLDGRIVTKKGTIALIR